ncbi:cell envelope integrity protein TolA [Desulfuromonas thiophila]|uniref:cell envelope integrity protein TolA n=1 Tax=Desulfuromonas thiophila TaxID=57664 RepID=UPI0024A88872|nr:cell envelope integrity protein TolA [Desulfuromonas thiophila]
MSTEQGVSAENSSVPGGLRRTLIVSLGLHLLLLALALSGWQFHRQKPRPQVYQVNLLHKPVMRPQAGRPDAPTKPQKPAAKPAAPARPPQPAKPKAPPKPAEPKAKVPPPAKQPPKPLPPKPAAKPAPKPEPKAAPKAEPKPVVPPKPAPVTKAKEVAKPNIDQQYSQTQDAIAEMRRRQQNAATQESSSRQRIEELKRQLAEQAQRPLPTTAGVTAPVGQVGGSGDQIGVDMRAWIEEKLASNWILPDTYRDRGLRAEMRLRFSPQGALLSFNLIRSSGNAFFDDSVQRAVALLQQEGLPTPPERVLELTIAFDPEEML